ncbi:hypothetical protein TYRP_013236 [Tyrophagus putrescentiae]|nr:hypothetical protein TYRP_013236 [Tyrophagus putrescentiae]
MTNARQQRQQAKQHEAESLAATPSAPAAAAALDSTPPHPPPRMASQTSQMSQNNSSKVIPLTARVEKPVRPVWFRVAYVALLVAIIGIATIVIGTILIVLGWISVRTGDGRAVYFGRRVHKYLGIYVLVIGLSVTFFSWLAYKACLIRIDRYIGQLQEYNSKKTQDARERVPAWTETDALMEEEEDDYYLEKKQQQMKQKSKK